MNKPRPRLSHDEWTLLTMYRAGDYRALASMFGRYQSVAVPEFDIPGTDARPGPKFIEVGECRALVFGDIHLPYHDPIAIKLALRAAFVFNVDVILLNGDTLDFYGISKYVKESGKRTFAEEIRIGRRFLEGLRKAFPNARIIYKVGNHDARWINWLKTEGAQLAGLEELELRSLLWLDRYNVEYVDSYDGVKLGKLHVLHGHEIAGGGKINPARNILLKQFTSVMVNHWHIQDTKPLSGLNGEQRQAWVNGCMCGLSPDYLPRNDWVQGFALVGVEDSGDFCVHHKRIREGRVE